MEQQIPFKVCIKTSGGNYLVEKRNGGFNVGGTDEKDATRWLSFGEIDPLRYFFLILAYSDFLHGIFRWEWWFVQHKLATTQGSQNDKSMAWLEINVTIKLITFKYIVHVRLVTDEYLLVRLRVGFSNANREKRGSRNFLASLPSRGKLHQGI